MALDEADFPSSDPANDYGSDWDEDLVDELLTTAATPTAGLEAPLLITDIEDYEAPKTVRLPGKVLGRESWSTFQARARSSRPLVANQTPNVRDSEPDEEVATSESFDNIQRERRRSMTVEREDEKDTKEDVRSPLERFRGPPKKPLSVTDLVSPAWCELQYFYTLAKHGKKKRTPAMKQGTKIHKKLEDEVHTTYPVSIQTSEDGWGLRIWNVIQGLRTLHETGRTRELEVWGIVDGEFVNGIIDELSYDMPDPKGETNATKILPKDQASIADYLMQHAGGNDMATALDRESTSTAGLSPTKAGSSRKMIYLTDIKTRSAKSVPDTSSTLPTQFQLFLYHHFLEQVALGNLPLQAIAERYGLDTEATFSDEFIVQVGGLNDIYDDVKSTQGSDTTPVPGSQSSMDMLLGHNNLRSLWELMLSHFQEIFITKASERGPMSASSEQSSQQVRLSPILTATYLASDTSNLIGHKTFQFDQGILDTYLENGMLWWKGKRPAKGVELSEVNRKCRWCDFRDDCEWLQARDLANLRKVREKWRERGDASMV